MLGRQCGIQDQLASAYRRDQLHRDVRLSGRHGLARCWCRIRSGGNSSGASFSCTSAGRTIPPAIHEEVIRSLEGRGTRLSADRRPAPTGARSRDALYAGDFNALGRAMTESTEAQGRLHSALVGTEARRSSRSRGRTAPSAGRSMARAARAGRSRYCAARVPAARRALIREIEQASTAFRSIPIYLSRHGLRVWRQDLD